MAGRDPAIQSLRQKKDEDVNDPHKAGHDDVGRANSL
jgi:hypothetical protein